MRVVGGIAKGRKLRAPAGRETRPTSDRVREAIFDMVTSRAELEGAAVADLFAGSGALGIEALSRGATSAVFVETRPDAVALIRRNLADIGFEGDVHQRDVLAYLASAPAFDVVFADPPYAWTRWQDVLDVLDASLVVIESDREVEPSQDWRVLKVRRYGDTVVTLISPALSAPSKGSS